MSTTTAMHCVHRDGGPLASALGFIRLPSMCEASEVGLEQAVNRFAVNNDLRLTRIYFQLQAVSFDTIDDLIAELRLGDIRHLIVPTLEHFAASRLMQNIYLGRLEAEAGVDVHELQATDH